MARGRPCSICNLPEHKFKYLTELLLKGTPLKEISVKVQVGLPAVTNHCRKHVDVHWSLMTALKFKVDTEDDIRDVFRNFGLQQTRKYTRRTGQEKPRRSYTRRRYEEPEDDEPEFMGVHPDVVKAQIAMARKISRAMGMLHFEELPISPEELKDQFRKVAFLYHPDRGGNDNWMAEVKLAHDILLKEITG